MKQYVKLFEQFVNENSKSTYDYGCAMVYFDFPTINELHSQIDEEDLYTEEGDKTYGLEDEPHATLLYGIHSDEIQDNEIIDKLKETDIGKIILHNASLFENDKYDVLKLDAFNGKLHELNDKLKEFPFTSDYPDYHPHTTIAYIKKGKGKKYVDKFKGNHFEVFPSKYVYSKPDGSKLEEKIEQLEEVNEAKNFLGDDLGILYDQDQKIMYIGSSKDSLVNYTLYDIQNEEDVFKIKEVLKDIEPDAWKSILRDADFEIGSGDEYFKLVK